MAKENSKPGPAPRLNWTKVRDEYIAGTESTSEIAKRYGVTQSAVSKHAFNREQNGGKTWTDLRDEWRSEQSAKALASIGVDQQKVIANLNLLRVQVATRALQRISTRLEGNTVDDAVLATYAKLGIDPHLRVSGPNGDDAVPVAIELDPESLGLIDRALEAALGGYAREARPESS